MDADVKATGLKQLQGLIWQSGFESGELKAHVYDDVPPALAAWNAAGKDVRIYSSGSVQAQTAVLWPHDRRQSARRSFAATTTRQPGRRKKRRAIARSPPNLACRRRRFCS